MKRKSFKMMIVALLVGLTVCGCGQKASESTPDESKSNKKKSESKANEEDVTLEELTKETEEEILTDSASEEEILEEGSKTPEAMPEIMEASFADGKIQIFDRMVDISFMCTNPQNLFKEEMKPDAFAYVEAHKSGTFQELYDWAVNYGFISANTPNMDQLVLNQSAGGTSFYVKKNPYMGNEAIAIFYFNNSGEGKKLGECDAYIYLPGLYDVNKKTGWISPYTYYPGGIHCEDPYWNYQTVIDYLKKNGYEYTESQSGDRITITTNLDDVIEYTEFYDKKMIDMKVTFFIDANDTDLFEISLFTNKM